MTSLYTAETPAGVKDAKGLHLITQSTPNGQKVQIMLEELADLYSLNWTTTLIDIGTNEQKKDWFLRLNPNGRIPVLADSTQARPFSVMETSAELLYLQEHYDKEGKLGFKDAREASECLQWLIFWHGSGATYQGNTNFFKKKTGEQRSQGTECNPIRAGARRFDSQASTIRSSCGVASTSPIVFIFYPYRVLFSPLHLPGFDVP